MINDYKKAKEKAKKIINEAPQYDVERPKYKPTKRPMKKTLNALIRTISGENKTGQAIHGILDLVPIPNQAIAKAVKYLFAGDVKEAKEELTKLLSFRNIVALLGCVAFLTGLITIDDLTKLVELFS